MMRYEARNVGGGHERAVEYGLWSLLTGDLFNIYAVSMLLMASPFLPLFGRLKRLSI